MEASQIPVKFQDAFGFGAGPSYIRRIPLLSQIGIQAGAASLTDGFPPVTFSPVGSGGTPPFGADFNGLLNQITLWSVWQAAGSPVAYDSGFSTAIGGYPQGAVIAGAASGVFWLCLVDNNLTDPDTGGAGWAQILTGTAASGVPAYRYLGSTYLTASGASTVTPPAGALTANIELWGGGGGTSNSNAGNPIDGAGAGEYRRFVYTLPQPLAPIAYTIGAGGTPTSYPTVGNSGGNTTIGGVTANGGAGSAFNSVGIGGSGGAGSGLSLPGQTGGPAAISGSSPGGIGGSASRGGPGGPGGGGTIGGNGSVPGGAGGGPAAGSLTGSTGATGAIFIDWYG